MNLFDNPFYTLGAATRDDRQRIEALGEAGGAAGREAALALLDAKRRLAAELSWFPGMTALETADLVAALEGDADEGGAYSGDFPNEIAAVNYLCHSLPRLAGDGTAAALANAIDRIAAIFAGLDEARLRDILNVDRSAAALPLLENGAEALALLGRQLERKLIEVLAARPPEERRSVLALLAKGQNRTSPLIAALIGAAPAPGGNVNPPPPTQAPARKQKDDHVALILGTTLGGIFVIATLYIVFLVVVAFAGSVHNEPGPAWEDVETMPQEELYDDDEPAHWEGNPPDNGFSWNFTDRPLLAPLEITTPAGDDYYYVLLVDAETWEHAAAYFIWPDASEEVLAPLGEYYVLFAYGDKWHDSDLLFGDDTYYEEASGVFEFYDDGEYYVGTYLDLTGRILDFTI